MFTEERRQEILNMLEKDGRVLAKDLAQQFNLSIDSIRRDLTIMEEQGLLQRTHGGAIPVAKVRTFAQPPEKRYGEGSSYHNAIAELASSYIKENQTIFLGGAAIHYVMLNYLPISFPYTVITNSVEIAYHLRKFNNIDTFVIGGKMKSSGNITDALATEFASQFSLDLCFATAGALSPNGLSTASPEVSVFHRTIYNNSKKVVALMDHTGFGVEMFSHMYPVQKLDIIITDEETTEDKIDLIKAQGVEVLVAK